MEEFLRKQAAIESGITEDKTDLSRVVGADKVSDEEAKEYCREIVTCLKTLRENREMPINEVKLVIAIEDPRAREQRQQMGIEAESGVSREEIAQALSDVVEGRIPKDRIALRELYREMTNWPFLDREDEAPAAMGEYEGVDSEVALVDDLPNAQGWRSGQARPPVGRDDGERPQSLADMLPDWVGYGFLYFISVLPAIIAGSVVLILFLNSLK